MKTNRSTFLAAAAAGSVLLADARSASAARPNPFPHARADMLALLQLPARHRMIMGAPRINGGSCFKTAHMLNGYEFGYGEGPGTVNLIISLYGPASIMLMMNDKFWAESKAFDLCTAMNDMPQTILRGPRNPFYHAHSSLNPNDDPEDPNGFYLDLSGEALVKRGAHFVICNNALHTASRMFVRLNGGGDAKTYYDQMRSHLLPHAMVVPSGEQALVVAQENHFAYVQAS